MKDAVEINLPYLVHHCCQNQTFQIITLQEKEKTNLTYHVSQWNQRDSQWIMGHFFWAIICEIRTECKGQYVLSNYGEN